MATKKSAKATSKEAKSSTKNTTAKATSTNKTASQSIAPEAKKLKTIGWMAILESLVIGALGIILIVNATGVARLIFYILGIFLIVKGAYKILDYFATRGQYDFYNNDLLYGIIALVFGVVAVVLWEQLTQVTGIVVGAWMIYGALVRLNAAIKLRAAHVKNWLYVLLLSLVMLALGIYVIINMGAALWIIGWAMIAAAVVGILDDLAFIKYLDKIAR